MRKQGSKWPTIRSRKDQRIEALKAALDCIPAKLMLTCGPPYTLNFGEEALRKIDAALDAAREKKHA